jgi:hypothetical protein
LDAVVSGKLERRIKATTVAVRDWQRAEIVVLSATGPNGQRKSAGPMADRDPRETPTREGNVLLR